MKVSDLEISDSHDIAIESIYPGAFSGIPFMKVVEIRKAGDDLISIETDGKRVIAGLSAGRLSDWSTCLGGDNRRLVVLVVHDDTSAVLRIWSFSRAYEFIDFTISIHLGDELLSSIAAVVGTSVDDESVQSWLKDEFLIDVAGKDFNRFVLRVDPNVKILSSAFVLVGRHRELDINLVGGSLYAIRLAPKRPESFMSTILVSSKIIFTNDLSVENTNSSTLFSFLESDGYLKMWSRYGEAEFAEEIKIQAELGEVNYSSSEETINGTWRFVLDGPSDFLAQVANEMSLDARDGSERQSHRGSRFSGAVHGKDLKRFTVDICPMTSSMSPAPVGTLTYAIGGSTTIQKRRKIAIEKIAGGNSQIKGLAEVLEMKSSRPRKVDRVLSWDSPAVRAIFKGIEPTEAQKRAIEVALNTPDIAIIQGPPGTGKTQVISAIAARIAEEMGSNSATRQVLLSSFQHEAVDNVASRTMVFGLPTIKESAADSGRSWLKTWRLDQQRFTRELFEKEEQGALSLKRNEILEMRTAYLLSPIADASAGEMLEGLSHSVRDIISATLEEELLLLASRLRRKGKSSEKILA